MLYYIHIINGFWRTPIIGFDDFRGVYLHKALISLFGSKHWRFVLDSMLRVATLLILKGLGEDSG